MVSFSLPAKRACSGLLHGTQGNLAGEEFGGADAAQSVGIRDVRAGVNARRRSERSSCLRQRCLVQLSCGRLHRVAIRRHQLRSHPCHLARLFANFRLLLSRRQLKDGEKNECKERNVHKCA